jgi:tRNA(adenine34) deaminase
MPKLWIKGETMDFLKEAISEAKKALLLGEVPVGAVIVLNNRVIARAHNLKETLNDPSAHAEILAIREASGILQNWRLSECEMYVTLEPCPMCAGAISESRIKSLYIGTFDPTKGGCGSVINIAQNVYLNNHININWMYNEECSILLKDFFKRKR